MKLIVKNDIHYYFKKGDIVEFHSIDIRNNNYMWVIYNDPNLPFRCTNAFWKWHFTKWELNKNVRIL